MMFSLPPSRPLFFGDKTSGTWYHNPSKFLERLAQQRNSETGTREGIPKDEVSAGTVRNAHRQEYRQALSNAMEKISRLLAAGPVEDVSYDKDKALYSFRLADNQYYEFKSEDQFWDNRLRSSYFTFRSKALNAKEADGLQSRNLEVTHQFVSSASQQSNYLDGYHDDQPFHLLENGELPSASDPNSMVGKAQALREQLRKALQAAV